MKKLALLKSTAILLALTLAGVVSTISTIAQNPIKKKVKVVVVGDSLEVNATDTTFFIDDFSVEEIDNQTVEDIEEISINLDSINCVVQNAMKDIHIELDSIPMDIDFPDVEFLNDKLEGSVPNRIEIKKVDDSNPKELEEALRKLELEGKITTKAEYSGVKTISVSTKDKTEEKVWLQLKGKKEWIDAKTGEPIKMKHRAIRMPRQPRQHRTLRMSCDTAAIQGGKSRHIYIARSNGHNRIIDTDCSDTLTTTITANGAYYFTTDSINNHTRHGKRVKRIIVNSNNDSNEDIYVTVTEDDSAKVTRRPGKRNMVWVSTNGQKHNRNGKHTKIRHIKLQLSSDITTEEKTMLEKSGFKKENTNKQLSDENLSIILNTNEGKMKVGFNFEGKGTVLIKIADSKGTILADDKNSLKNGSFEKEYTFQQPSDGIFFLQVTFDGKSLTRKIQIKN